jgi:hypothetical protein
MKINKETLVNIIKEELRKEMVLQEGVKAKLTALGLATLMGLLGKVGSDAKEATQAVKAKVKKLEDETAKKKALAAFLAGQLSQEELDKALGDK